MKQKDLKSIFEFLEHLYRGNTQYRWKQVPFMNQVKSPIFGESILSHQWSCIFLWQLLRKIMKACDSCINANKVYEILSLHDIGETCIGDTPIVIQLKKGKVEKEILEEKEIELHTNKLPSQIRSYIQKIFKEYNNEKSQSLEIICARYINALQGNHYALTHGYDLEKHSELICKILEKYFIPISDQLIQALIDQNKHDAANEIKTLTSWHVSDIQKHGIKLNKNILRTVTPQK